MNIQKFLSRYVKMLSNVSLALARRLSGRSETAIDNAFLARTEEQPEKRPTITPESYKPVADAITLACMQKIDDAQAKHDANTISA